MYNALERFTLEGYLSRTQFDEGYALVLEQLRPDMFDETDSDEEQNAVDEGYEESKSR